MAGRPPLPPPDQPALLANALAMLEEVPVGLLLLDAELRPLWFNAEAARACAVWNHGERRAAALRVRSAFRVPAPLLAAGRALLAAGPAAAPAVVSDHARGLHARIKLLQPGAGSPPAFHLQLDYRRPRGDRHRPLSPGAVALLARLSEREREVAMRVREGLRTTEIAAELRRSPLTIKTQLAAIFAKLDVRGRTRVAALLSR
jgi:DNA-binding NarL/FixJ family response regulator